jgi:ZIP family zinc transporter
VLHGPDTHPVLLALFGTLLTWLLTALGSATVFLRREYPQRLLDAALGFAAGVMLAASYFSLLAPSVEASAGSELPVWAPPAIGFLLGGAFVGALDQLVPHLHIGERPEDAEGVDTAWERTTLLWAAMTLHNVPEGLAVGVAFGASGGEPAQVAAATALAVGIGVQNLPEGMAVSVPFRRLGMSRPRAFFWGQTSGVVEVVAGVTGALLVSVVEPLLAYGLAFGAGAMVYVVVEEVLPEAHRSGYEDTITVATLVGFTIMMVLDVALG